MMISRLASIVLRLAQFVLATVVLGLTSYFLYKHTHYSVGPFGRTVYSIIWASLSIIFSIIWIIPTTSTMTGYASDFVFTAGWAAVFGLLVSWFNRINCGSAWIWSAISISRDNYCGQWRAAQAFAFLSMIMWFATGILGLITVHRLAKRPIMNRGSGKNCHSSRV